jgi:hypothetical protein
MASTSLIVICVIVGLILWMGPGYAIARSLGLRRDIALPLALVLGWAVQNPLALMLSQVLGFSLVATCGAVALIGVAAVLTIRRTHAEPDDASSMPLWLYLVAAAVAVGPLVALLPKHVGDGVIVASAVFDHSKIALVDQIVREGIPLANPIYGGIGVPDGVAYYYLWHFGAAQLAKLTGATGWEADAAASWLTAFSTLCLMAGIALRLSRRRLSAVFAIAVSCLGSLRPLFATAFGWSTVDRWLEPSTGFTGWLFQASWSPHHVQAAGCVVVATMIVAQLARQPSAPTAIVLALLATAAYQSSIWVGGVVFSLSTTGIVLFALRSRFPGGMWRFFPLLCVSALAAVAMAFPLLVEQYHAAVGRGGGSPIALAPFQVFGPALPHSLGRALDVPAYWLLLLVLEFPLVYLAGGLILARMAAQPGRSPLAAPADGFLVRSLSLLTAASLGVSWLLASTTGLNNDLGWRAVLPGLMVLAAAAGAGLAWWVERRAAVALVLAAVAVAGTAPDGLAILADNAFGNPSSSAEAFAQSPAMWRAVRRHTPIDARVANNPALFADMTPWPVNLSWALLADRRSCFAGNELAIAFAALPLERRTAISDQFLRVFAGDGTPDDIRALAHTHRCDVVLVTSFDGAWRRDPFATSALYRLVEAEPERWRIYVATTASPPQAANGDER